MAAETTRRVAALVWALALVVGMLAVAAPAVATEGTTEPPPTVPEDPPPPPPDDPPPPPSEEPPPEDPAPPADEPTDPPGDDEGGYVETPKDGDVETPEEPVVFDPEDPAQILRDIVFPVVGPTWWDEGFGDCRDGCTRLHKGIDIMTYGWKGVPVVAAHDGTVVWTSIGQPLSGCGVVLAAEDGWTTVYTHLNTDTPGTDDGAYPCLAPGIEIGATVLAGTLLGWVGDAGNAEETPPHLHFEIRHPEHGAVDPAVSLEAADEIEHRWLDAADLDGIAAAMHPEATTLYVVPSFELELVASTVDELEALDVPLVPFDPADPVAAWVAIESIGPERIVVVTQDPTAGFIEDLLSIAAIVEVVTVTPEVPAPDAATPDDQETGTEPADDVETEQPLHGAIDPPGRIIGFESVDPDTTIVIATSRRVSSSTLRSLEDQPAILLIGRRPPADVGTTSDDAPGREANRNGLWWPTADGWRITDEISAGPDPSIAYVTGADITPWTLAYLASRATAPPMPWWHHQPTSLATKSL